MGMFLDDFGIFFSFFFFFFGQMVIFGSKKKEWRNFLLKINLFFFYRNILLFPFESKHNSPLGDNISKLSIVNHFFPFFLNTTQHSPLVLLGN